MSLRKGLNDHEMTVWLLGAESTNALRTSAKHDVPVGLRDVLFVAGDRFLPRPVLTSPRFSCRPCDGAG